MDWHIFRADTNIGSLDSEQKGWIARDERAWILLVVPVFYFYYMLQFNGVYSVTQRLLLALSSSFMIMSIELYRSRCHIAILFMLLYQQSMYIVTCMSGDTQKINNYIITIIGIVVCFVILYKRSKKAAKGKEHIKLGDMIGNINKPIETPFIYNLMEVILIYIFIMVITKETINRVGGGSYRLNLMVATDFLELSTVILSTMMFKTATIIRMVWCVVWCAAIWFGVYGAQHSIIIPILYLGTELLEESREDRLG